MNDYTIKFHDPKDSRPISYGKMSISTQEEADGDIFADCESAPLLIYCGNGNNPDGNGYVVGYYREYYTKRGEVIKIYEDVDGEEIENVIFWAPLPEEIEAKQ